ncbi:MAG: TIGR01548 family HAD-type hydrolase [Phycisphaerales bacterium]|nr:TIGR01548 family HAD-type hydrolase [Planctomycetota bacterium]
MNTCTFNTRIADRIRSTGANRYSPPKPRCGAPIDLWLDANEGRRPDIEALVCATGLAGAASQYPSAAPLEQAIAAMLGVDHERVLVTAGADEAIDRVCRTFLGPGREIVVPAPTFEMIGKYARMTGATVREVAWSEDRFPLAELQGVLSDKTSVVAVVSPNNPTGAVVTEQELKELSESAPDAILLVDLAYAEFAECDLTAAALTLPNAVLVRTFSKAHGLAGLRVGYAAGSRQLIEALRGAGSPYPVSALSLAVAQQAIASASAHLPPVVSRCRKERDVLLRVLSESGVRVRPSQGNFVLARATRAEWLWEALASLGIAVRRFPPGGTLDGAIRITCPCDEAGFDRLVYALRSILQPQAILFDMDGVLADVSRSYRAAIEATALGFGVRVSQDDISAAKAAGNANNDWDLTRKLINRGGVNASLSAVKERFELFYQGGPSIAGYRERETLLPPRGLLERLAGRMPLAIVTGRPRFDCDRFLDRFGLQNLFATKVCMEDAPAKPDPAPVRLALARLGVERAWMIGDTPDDIASARSASVVPIGFVPPGEAYRSNGSSLRAAGAATVLNDFAQLEDLLS